MTLTRTVTASVTITEEDLRKELDEMEASYEDMSWTRSMDAQVWAQQFVAHKKKNKWKNKDIDESLMIGWFANAIMAGYDEAVKRTRAHRNDGD